MGGGCEKGSGIVPPKVGKGSFAGDMPVSKSSGPASQYDTFFKTGKDSGSRGPPRPPAPPAKEEKWETFSGWGDPGLEKSKPAEPEHTTFSGWGDAPSSKDQGWRNNDSWNSSRSDSRDNGSWTTGKASSRDPPAWAKQGAGGK